MSEYKSRLTDETKAILTGLSLAVIVGFVLGMVSTIIFFGAMGVLA